MSAASPGNEAGPAGRRPPPLTLYLIKRLEMVVRALLDERLRPLGVTAAQYTALSVLAHRGGLSSAQLARRAFVRPQTMHEMVLWLEQRGLIARRAAEGNRRVLLASLTADGEDLLQRCAPAVAEIEERLAVGLGPARADGFRLALTDGCDVLADLARGEPADGAGLWPPGAAP